MTDITHPELVATLVKPGEIIAAEMTAKEADLWHGATGVAGETTEILEAAIKGEIEGEIDHENMVEELGDMEFYLEQVRTNLGITREDVLAAYEGHDILLGKDFTGFAACLAVAGGTVLDLAKKVAIYKKPASRLDFLRALYWIEVCMGAIRNEINTTREEALAGNIAKLSVRYAGLKYSNEAAQTRADKAEGE